MLCHMFLSVQVILNLDKKKKKNYSNKKKVGYDSSNSPSYFTGLNDNICKQSNISMDDFMSTQMTSCKIDQEYNYYMFPIQDYEVHQFVLQPPALPSPVRMLNTVILNSNEIKLLYTMTGAKSFRLLHRGSVNGFSSDSFHLNCDNIPNTIVILKSLNNDFVFGGYASVTWDKKSGYKKDKTAYQFSLRRNGRSEIFQTSINPYKSAIFCNSSSFISFNNGLQFIENTDPLTLTAGYPTVSISACNGVWLVYRLCFYFV